MSGREFVDRARDLVEGRLSPEEARALRAEAAADGELAALLESMESVHALTAADAAEPLPACGGSFEALAAMAGIPVDASYSPRVSGRGGSSPARPPASRPRLLRRPRLAFAAAAVLLAAVALAAPRLLAPPARAEVVLHAIPLEAAAADEAPDLPESLETFRPVADGKVRWLTSLDEALPLSRASGRPVLLYVFHPTCPYCIEMDKTAFRDGAVQKDIDSFIPVRVNVMKAAPSVQRRVEAGWPYLGALDGEGNTLDEFPGFHPAADLERELGEALEKAPGVADAVPWDRLAAMAVRYRAARARAVAGAPGEAWNDYETLIDESPASAPGRAAATALAGLRGDAARALREAMAAGERTPSDGVALLERAERTFAGSAAAADFLAVRRALEQGGRVPVLIVSSDRR